MYEAYEAMCPSVTHTHPPLKDAQILFPSISPTAKHLEGDKPYFYPLLEDGTRCISRGITILDFIVLHFNTDRLLPLFPTADLLHDLGLQYKP